MNARFLIPATVALAIHGGLLFGIPRPVRAEKSQAAETRDNKDRITMPPPDIEVLLVADDDAPAKRGEEIARPANPEPVTVVVEFDRPIMDKPPIVTGPVVDARNIVDIGRPDGDVRSAVAKVGIFRGGDLDNPPRARFQAAPNYPHGKRQLGETGEVWIEFDVDESGAVHHPRVTKSSDRAFEEPTLRAVAKWRFEPGKRHGKVVPFRMTVPVIFSLNE